MKRTKYTTSVARRFFSLCLLLLSTGSAYGQFQEVFPQPDKLKEHPAYQQLSNAYQVGRWEDTFNIAIALADRYPEEESLYLYIGNALYHNKQYPVASKYYQAAVALYPFNSVNLTHAVMGAMYAKEPQVVTDALYTLSFVPMSTEEKTQAESYLQGLLNNFTPYPAYANVINALQQGLQQYQQNYPDNMTFHEQYVKMLEDFDTKTGPFPQNAFAQLKAKKNAGAYPAVLYDYMLGITAVSCVASDQALFQRLLPDFHASLAEKRGNPLSKYFLYRQLERHGENVKDYEAIISVSKIMLSELNSSGIAPALSHEVLINLTDAFLKKKDINQAKEYGQSLTEAIPKITNQKHKIDAYNTAGVAMSYVEKAKATQLFDEGIAYAKRTGAKESQINGLTRNREGFINNKVLVTDKSNEKSFIVAENQGVVLTNQDKYEEAIPHFVRSKKIIESEMAVASPDKVKGLLADYNRICNLLIGCIAHVRSGEDLLPVIEDIKGYSLAESTSKNKRRATLKEIQAVLQPDEALIYYIDISAELKDGYYIPLVLTKDKVHFGFSFARNSFLPEVYAGFNTEIGEIEKELAKKEFRTPVYTQYQSRDQAKGQDFKQGEMGLLIEFYRRKLNPPHEELVNGTYNPNIAKGIGMALYNMLLQMFEPELAGKKHLIFSLDGELNYLPFETLVTKDKQYLVQKYDISYIPSGTVLANLRSRKPRVYSKSVLAFGDARYSARASKGYPLHSQTDVERVELKVKEAIATDQNLDVAFATFSKTAANYLIGTKEEVEMIKKIVPDADIFLNEKMTENEFKRLNASGSLNNYRIIHLASHAGVHPYVFDLSGIMFSVFPQPVGNEDGELVVSEVAKLKMAPELVMLSACQTGLGKLVPGDGVAGLNHAFLMAGANSTITSLWNVNDYATSVLVSRLYQKVFQEKKAYFKALNEVKREFISSGDPMLQLSLSWAPFIYTGK